MRRRAAAAVRASASEVPFPARELVVFAAPLALLSCATPSPITDPEPDPPGWVCQRTYRSGETQFWVNQALDSGARPLGRSAGYRTHGSPSVDLFWEFPVEGPWHSNPTTATVDFGVKRPPRGPVTAFLHRSGQRLVERVIIERKGWRGWRRIPHWGGSIGFYGADARIPDFHGVTDLRLSVVDPQGALLDAPVPLPDWAWIDARVAEAMPELAADAEAQFELTAAGELSESRCMAQSGPDI